MRVSKIALLRDIIKRNCLLSSLISCLISMMVYVWKSLGSGCEVHRDVVSFVSEVLGVEPIIRVDYIPLLLVHVGLGVHCSSVEEDNGGLICHSCYVDEVVLHLHLEINEIGLIKINNSSSISAPRS